MPNVEDIVGRYLGAIVGNDWDALKACLADDVVRVGPYGDSYTGRDEYVAFIADVMPRLPGYEMRVDRVTYAGAVALAELSETIEVSGKRHRTPEALVFDLDDNGRIRRIEIFMQTLSS
jgi:ketosteroid isomerase-like protein